MKRFVSSLAQNWRPVWMVTVGVIGLLSIVATGGGGGSGSSLGGSPSKLFISDKGNQEIGSLINSNPAMGTVVFNRNLAGAATLISSSVAGLAIDATNNRLYVANGSSILVFNSANTASGSVAPARTLTATMSGFVDIRSLFLDTASDRLFVADNATGVWIIDDVGTVSGTGGVRRQLTGNFGGGTPLAAAVDTSATNALYVSSGNQVAVFSSAATTHGSVAAARTITPNPAGTVASVFVDSSPSGGRLYMAVGSRVEVFDGASAVADPIDPTATPVKTIVLPSTVTHIAVDITNDRLYAVGPTALHIVNHASTADSAVTAVPVTTLLTPTSAIFNGVAVRP